MGAEIARLLHRDGFNVIVHYRSSQSEAMLLTDEFNRIRPDSAISVQADLLKSDQVHVLAETALAAWGGLDVLVNNASSFYPTAFDQVSEQQWDELLNSNLKAPFFLARAVTPALKRRNGCLVNIIDIHAERGLQGYPVYSIAKAGLAAMTRVLAKELGPEIRVNGVSPGAILWPETGMADQDQAEIVRRVLLQRRGDPVDIAKAVSFLIQDADYITGQIIAVDGGRALFC